MAKKTKLEVSKLSLVWKWLTGGIEKVADYLLDLLNNALANLDDKDKESIQAVLNYATKIAASLTAFAWLVPSKWQTAYKATLKAVQAVVDALSDLTITADELLQLKEEFAAAVLAWKGEDDETCADCCEEK